MSSQWPRPSAELTINDHNAPVTCWSGRLLTIYLWLVGSNTWSKDDTEQPPLPPSVIPDHLTTAPSDPPTRPPTAQHTKTRNQGRRPQAPRQRRQSTRTIPAVSATSSSARVRARKAVQGFHYTYSSRRRDNRAGRLGVGSTRSRSRRRRCGNGRRGFGCGSNRRRSCWPTTAGVRRRGRAQAARRRGAAHTGAVDAPDVEVQRAVQAGFVVARPGHVGAMGWVATAGEGVTWTEGGEMSVSVM
jgi:hypothetical protein